MNLLDLIAKAKALIALTKDPTVSLWTKVAAYLEFVSLLKDLIPAPNEPNVIGAVFAETASADDIIADIEANATVFGNVGPVGANGEILKKFLALLLKLAPLLI